ncbi:MAG TPA: 30S ribosomal protein S17, partial [Candidatus Altiarchaeales archaeon]|nr:30S ribosomal protein S17 [Candidatus Altiarchaeales archaeon]
MAVKSEKTKTKSKVNKKAEKSKAECGDINCPIHGTLPTRGIVLDGTVVSDKMDKTVIVERNYRIKEKKFERYRSARSRIPAHNPPC